MTFLKAYSSRRSKCPLATLPGTQPGQNHDHPYQQPTTHRPTTNLMACTCAILTKTEMSRAATNAEKNKADPKHLFRRHRSQVDVVSPNSSDPV